jgi:hypothetical protein
MGAKTEIRSLSAFAACGKTMDQTKSARVFKISHTHARVHSHHFARDFSLVDNDGLLQFLSKCIDVVCVVLPNIPKGVEQTLQVVEIGFGNDDFL